MKKTIFLTLLLITTLSYSQKKEKVKGSKIVTIEIKKIEPFEAIEVLDNIEVFIIKGSEYGLEIEADDNLHDAIDIVLNGSTLKLSTLKNAFGYKKLSVRITYNDSFKSVITRNESSVTALSDIELESITLKSYDESKLFINSKAKNFTLIMDDKSKIELNSKADKSAITLSKNAKLKALITSKDLTFDMYQKTDAIIEGDTDNLKLRLDNNATFNGKKLTAKNTEVITESYTNASILCTSNIIIEASGKSEIELYGDQKIELKRFVDSAILKKKPTK
ncbi:MAG: GIN domain-containing protein [Flavobacterium sp.]